MHGAQTVGKAGVESTGEDQVGQADLLDATEPLKIGVLDDVKMQFVGDADKSIDWIVDDFFLVRFHLFKN